MTDIKQYLEQTNTVLLTKDAFEYLKEKAGALDKIRAEIQKVLDAERDFTSENAKAQAIALSWCLEIIDKYRKGANV